MTEMIDRYPNKAEPPLAWAGWRRVKGSYMGWQAVEGTSRPTRGECYDALMQLSELVAGETQHEYLILPVGQRPEAFAGQERGRR